MVSGSADTRTELRFGGITHQFTADNAAGPTDMPARTAPIHQATKSCAGWERKAERLTLAVSHASSSRRSSASNLIRPVAASAGFFLPTSKGENLMISLVSNT